MTYVTDIRTAVAGAFDVPEDVLVLVAPHDFGTSFGSDADPEELMMFARILATTEERIDELIAAIPGMLAADRTLDGAIDDASIIRCSGHQLFPTVEGPRLGVQWTVRVMRKT